MVAKECFSWRSADAWSGRHGMVTAAVLFLAKEPADEGTRSEPARSARWICMITYSTTCCLVVAISAASLVSLISELLLSMWGDPYRALVYI